MSTAWKGSAVILREPAQAVWPRLGYRVFVASAGALVGVYAPFAVFNVLGWVICVVGGLFALFTIVNLIKNRRVILVHTGAGSIEWPRSVQELLLRREVDWVAGREVVVTYPLAAVIPGRADPRVTLSAQDRQIRGVPLYGRDPAEWVEQANGVLASRGVVLRYDTSERDALEGDPDSPEESAGDDEH